jgi:actin related protein 2/3 complex subunit 3
VLIYGILWVSEVLGKIRPGMGRREAEKVEIPLLSNGARGAFRTWG